MSFFDELGLRAAEQLESSVGPFVALASYKRLLAGPDAVRARAAAAGLACAIALDDDREIAAMTLAYAAAPTLEDRTASAELRARVLRGAVDLLARGKTHLSAQVAAAEGAKSGSAIAAHIRARAVEGMLGHAADGGQLWWEVVERASEAGEARVHAYAAGRAFGACLERVRRNPSAELPRAKIAAASEKASLEGAGHETKLLVLRGRLLCASNFQRASALSALEEMARTAPPPASRMALVIAARHFDEMPFHLHPIEIDRVRAALKRLPEGPARDRAMERLEHTVRLVAAIRAEDPARADEALMDLVRGSDLARGALARLRAAAHGADAAGAEVKPDADASDRLSSHAVSALVALGKGRCADARVALDRTTELLSPDVPVPLPAWTAAARALGTEATESGAVLIGRAFARTTSFPPPPLVALATKLSRAGASSVAANVLDEAARMREPEARAARAEEARRRAYDALKRGDREGARMALTRARDLFAGHD